MRPDRGELAHAAEQRRQHAAAAAPHAHSATRPRHRQGRRSCLVVASASSTAALGPPPLRPPLRFADIKMACIVIFSIEFLLRLLASLLAASFRSSPLAPQSPLLASRYSPCVAASCRSSFASPPASSLLMPRISAAVFLSVFLSILLSWLLVFAPVSRISSFMFRGLLSSYANLLRFMRSYSLAFL